MSPAAALRGFFHGFTIPRARLELMRIVFFFLLGLDAFLQIEHAPRYGAGGFNVAHFSWMDQLLPMPGRQLMLVLFVVQAYLSFRVMAGVTIRASLALLTLLYGYTYFNSQVDSYQHHYLVFLLLVLFNLWPWKEGRAEDDPGETLPGWAVRVTMCQISILYLWTAVAKMDPHWLAGKTLRMQVADPWFRDLMAGFAGSLGVDELSVWAAAAWGVMLGELALAGAIHVRRLWPALVPLGVVFHMGIELSGFKIGLFSYLMMSLYILILPEAWLTRPAVVLGAGEEKKKAPKAAPAAGASRKKRKGAAAEDVEVAPPAPPRSPRPQGGGQGMFIGGFAVLVAIAIAGRFEHLENIEWIGALLGGTFLLSMALQYWPGRWMDQSTRELGRVWGIGEDDMRTWGLLAALVVVSSAVLWVMPFEEAPVYVGTIAGLGLLLDVRQGPGRLQRGVAHLLACALVLGCYLTTDQALNYYRFMGGDARRRGDLDTAIASYTKVTQVDPSFANGHKRLGDLYMRRKDWAPATASYERAAALDPQDGGILLALARAYDAAGRGPDVLRLGGQLSQVRLKEAERAEVERLVARWRDGGGGGPAAVPAGDEDDEAPADP